MQLQSQKNNEFFCLDDFITKVNDPKLVRLPGDSRLYSIIREYQMLDIFAVENEIDSQKITSISTQNTHLAIFSFSQEDRYLYDRIYDKFLLQSSVQIRELQLENSFQAHLDSNVLQLKQSIKAMSKSLEKQQQELFRLDSLIE